VGILTGVFSLDGYGCGDVVPGGYVPVAISKLDPLRLTICLSLLDLVSKEN
jgi:hypothetical protein